MYASRLVRVAMSVTRCTAILDRFDMTLAARSLCRGIGLGRQTRSLFFGAALFGFDFFASGTIGFFFCLALRFFFSALLFLLAQLSLFGLLAQLGVGQQARGFFALDLLPVLLFDQLALDVGALLAHFHRDRGLALARSHGDFLHLAALQGDLLGRDVFGRRFCLTVRATQETEQLHLFGRRHHLIRPLEAHASLGELLQQFIYRSADQLGECSYRNFGHVTSCSSAPPWAPEKRDILARCALPHTG